MTLTPPARAAVQSLVWRARQACHNAVMDDEQAVSDTIEGPLNLFTYDILPLWNARRVPRSLILAVNMQRGIRCSIGSNI